MEFHRLQIYRQRRVTTVILRDFGQAGYKMDIKREGC